ncbi:MAG: DNA cytosine methyltransferase [Deltaproteobacteria bacterium]
MSLRVGGLFSGIGGIERGFELSNLDVSTELLCEWWEPAQAVLTAHFDASIAPDVRALKALPSGIDLITAGFPCTDLSQAGLMAGIGGEASGLVSHVFRLLKRATTSKHRPTWLVIENVPNMLVLSKGEAMHYLVDQLDALGLRWAYRVVDSRFTGVPQRRRRVLLVASPTEDPRCVLFADDDGVRPESDYRTDAFGFYSTEGLRGLGWAQDATPTLKGGSTIGIPSQPAIWVPAAPIGRQLVQPTIEDAEHMQGFERGWTEPAAAVERRSHRWKLIGNAVTVGVARWLGDRLASPGDYAADEDLWNGKRWPLAAWGEGEKVWSVSVSEYPHLQPYTHLTDAVNVDTAPTLSHKAAAGFQSRLSRGNLGRHPGFREAVAAHVEATAT